MDQMLGYFLYAMSLLTMGGIYAILALGLNAQWGFAGLFNAGIAGFAALGAYTYALLTTADSPFHYGGLGLPLVVGELVAMVVSGMVAAVIGAICIRLRADYLAIATIGIAEIIKLVIKNETAITNGPRGINKIPRTWEHLTEERFYSSWPMSMFNTPEGWVAFFDSLPAWWWQPFFAATVLVIMFIFYFLLERARLSPWGRMMAAIRDNEVSARAAGKDVTGRRIEAFILGAVIMGMGGALLAQHLRLIEPTNTFDPAKMTFLVWVMLIAGGSGNNRGAILGGFLVWVLWSGSELMIKGSIDVIASIFSDWDPAILQTRAGFLRMLLIGLLLQLVLQKYPGGILPEKRPAVSGRNAKRAGNRE
jgi:branched-chain amino acid transport system permease protein